MKVYDVFQWLMYGQMRQSCLELQRNAPAGGLGVLSLFASFAVGHEGLNTPNIYNPM